MAEVENELNEALPFYPLNDDELLKFLHEVNIRNTNSFHDKVFNPFDMHDSNPIIDGLTDSEAFFFRKQSEILDNCSYYLEDQFNLKYSEYRNRNVFSLAHFNLRSLSKNGEKLHCYLNLLNVEFSAIAISETWVNNNHDTSSFNIPEYDLILNNRESKSGGGVGLYLKSNIKYQIRHDLKLSTDELSDSLFIEIIREKDKNIVIGVLYRPPDSNTAKFLESLETILSTIDKERKSCTLTGDFNFDLLNHFSHAPTNEYIDLLFSYSYFPLISRPTRIAKHSATLLDHIFTNVLENNIESGIFLSDISDHFGVFQIINSEIKVSSTVQQDYRRIFNDANVNSFITDVQNTDWDILKNIDSANDAYNEFSNIITNSLNKNIPLQKVKPKVRKLRKPWITLGLATSCKTKSRLYYKYIKNPSEYRSQKYKIYRNRLNRLIQEAKKTYFSDKLFAAKNDLKQTWKIIKEALNKRNNSLSSKYPSEFHLNDLTLTDKRDIANEFNSFFTNIGPNLDKNIPQSQTHFTSYLRSNTNEPLKSFNPTTADEVKNIITLLKNKASSGYDDIPTHLIKQAVAVLSHPLSYIINLSLVQGIFPDNLKIAKVIPLFKADDPSLFSNYRPISILPSFSKVYERVIFTRLLNHLNINNILYNKQYGFRKNHSTIHAIIDLLDNISQSIDQNKFTIGVFIDFSKAFDTVNHNILLKKMNLYGISDYCLSWFQSYLHNRQQFVEFQSTTSEYQTISCGVPQGSILGPLLFLIYINDLPNASKILHTILFADDTNLFYSHECFHTLISSVNEELHKITNWLEANRLSLNLSKTHFVIFTSSNKKYDSNMAKIVIGNETVKEENSTKFLGIFLDQHLTWKKHISYISLKLSKNIGVINKLKNVLPDSVLLTLYYTMIYPYITYGNIVWVSTYPTRLHTIYILQKRIVRMISHADYLAHTAPIFSKLGLLNIFQINVFQTACFVFKFSTRSLPHSFDNFFTLNNEIHRYNTRQSRCFHYFKNRTTLYRFSIRQKGPSIWNSLPPDMKSSHFHIFKHNLKQKLLNQPVN